MTHGKDCTCPGCMNEPSKRVRANGMTIDEAKEQLQEILAIYDPGHRKHTALELLLWMLAREDKVRKAIDASSGTDRWNGCVEVFHWEREHPRPGSDGT